MPTLGHVPAYIRSQARTNGRTTRKHNASGPSRRTGGGIRILCAVFGGGGAQPLARLWVQQCAALAGRAATQHCTCNNSIYRHAADAVGGAREDRPRPASRVASAAAAAARCRAAPHVDYNSRVVYTRANCCPANTQRELTS